MQQTDIQASAAAYVTVFGCTVATAERWSSLSYHLSYGAKLQLFDGLQDSLLSQCDLMYRKDIVGMARSLQQVDGTRVLKQERVFLQQLQARKLSRDISRRPTDDNLARARHMLVSFLCLFWLHGLCSQGAEL